MGIYSECIFLMWYLNFVIVINHINMHLVIFDLWIFLTQNHHTCGDPVLDEDLKQSLNQR